MKTEETVPTAAVTGHRYPHHTDLRPVEANHNHSFIWWSCVALQTLLILPPDLLLFCAGVVVSVSTCFPVTFVQQFNSTSNHPWFSGLSLDCSTLCLPWEFRNSDKNFL